MRGGASGSGRLWLLRTAVGFGSLFFIIRSRNWWRIERYCCISFWLEVLIMLSTYSAVYFFTNTYVVVYVLAELQWIKRHPFRHSPSLFSGDLKGRRLLLNSLPLFDSFGEVFSLLVFPPPFYRRRKWS